MRIFKGPRGPGIDSLNRDVFRFKVLLMQMGKAMKQSPTGKLFMKLISKAAFTQKKQGLFK